MYDLDPFVERVCAIVDAHAIDIGSYRRWTRSDAKGRGDDGANPYGCADAANILYTVARFPAGGGERAAWAGQLQAFQDPDDGQFHEDTHHPVHCTAHCLAALELFEARGAQRLHALEPLLEPDAIERYLDELDWSGNPWSASHRGAGAYAALTLAGVADTAWEDRYFAWLDRECDPETGMWRRGHVGPCPDHGNAVFPHLAGTFHYHFNYHAARRPFPHVDALIDSCLRLRAEDPFDLDRSLGFAPVDWVFCLNRARRQSAHRSAEAEAALRDYADIWVPWVLERSDAELDDLHKLFGVLCCLAELQQALPGHLRSRPALRLVLDRRPFI